MSEASYVGSYCLLPRLFMPFRSGKSQPCRYEKRGLNFSIHVPVHASAFPGHALAFVIGVIRKVGARAPKAIVGRFEPAKYFATPDRLYNIAAERGTKLPTPD